MEAILIDILHFLFLGELNHLRWILKCSILSHDIRNSIFTDAFLPELVSRMVGWKRPSMTVEDAIQRVCANHCRECMAKTRATAITPASRLRIRLCTHCTHDGYSRLVSFKTAAEEFGVKRRAMQKIRLAKVSGNKAHLFWLSDVRKVYNVLKAACPY